MHFLFLTCNSKHHQPIKNQNQKWSVQISNKWQALLWNVYRIWKDKAKVFHWKPESQCQHTKYCIISKRGVFDVQTSAFSLFPSVSLPSILLSACLPACLRSFIIISDTCFSIWLHTATVKQNDQSEWIGLQETLKKKKRGAEKNQSQKKGEIHLMDKMALKDELIAKTSPAASLNIRLSRQHDMTWAFGSTLQSSGLM